ncbi:MAG TPA: IS256 family transposase [Polyangiaceae bacterium]|nr:IS256 family transposase [Polyangiaceae bacterium]
MKKVAQKRDVRNEVKMAMVRGLGAIVRRDLRAFVVDAGMAALAELLESERTVACGPRHARQKDRQAYRAGHAPGELVMGGRRLSVNRPRARTVAGEEVELPSWRFFSAEDPLTERAMEQMIVGVSTRKYARSLEPASPNVKTRGMSKSAVSRHFVAKTEAQMDEWLGRDLSDISLAALMIDGVHVDDHVLLVALGIDVDGNKHVLGVREGATENSTSCTELLADLVERNLRTDYTILAVLDGAKALAKAVRAVWGKRVLIQRCQVHKLRNVTDQLPESMRPSVKKTMQQAYRARNAKTAKRLLANLLQRLRAEHPGAAGSLEEGLDETLTVMGFNLPEWLERTLATTNAIENLIGSFRNLSSRVRRWRDGKMILRWAATALVEASKQFRRLRGHAGMNKLVAALRAHDAALDGAVDRKEKAA